MSDWGQFVVSSLHGNSFFFSYFGWGIVSVMGKLRKSSGRVGEL